MSTEKKDFKVENGYGKDLEISQVYTHLNAVKPKSKEKDKKDKIIIPQTKK